MAQTKQSNLVAFGNMLNTDFIKKDMSSVIGEGGYSVLVGTDHFDSNIVPLALPQIIFR